MIKGATLRVTGIVQGVGFRPFIYKLAVESGLRGWVRNTTAGVEIEVDGDEFVIQEFARAIRREAPPLARIEALNLTLAKPRGHKGFEIRESGVIGQEFQPISPDVATCEDCRREMFDTRDRRYRYPFINCTNCGPRFSIIKDIPYDRPGTTMKPFPMCGDCAREYADPHDRRFHAQPVACPACGPHVWIEYTGRPADTPAALDDQAIRLTRALLADGMIVAVKGLGGFHLACDATNARAVAELRRRKLRVDKPFALMFPDIEMVRQHCRPNPSESALLESVARPIVLLRRSANSTIAAEVAPGQHNLGVMLPYTPLHFLLLERADGFPEALVMTSGNLSEEPLAFRNEEARARLATLADAFLMHNRDIHIRCDDSVVRLVSREPAAGANQSSSVPAVYPLRRSRGYVPFPVKLPWEVPPILAVGAELKNTFCVTKGTYAFVSHHIGDLENYETLRSFEQGIRHFEELFRAAPGAIAYDLHPDYLATRYAIKRSEANEVPAFGVQHHHAHIAACMAENGLLDGQQVIGVAFDGTGYGTDGAIWGGEIMLADYRGFKRLEHLPYFPLPGGDAAIRHPARTALALLWSLDMPWDERLASVRAIGRDDLSVLQTQLQKSLNTVATSSMGRLFDAAASLAGTRQEVNYEAQAAIEFEAVVDDGETDSYDFSGPLGTVSLQTGMGGLVEDVLKGVSSSVISARFHNGLARMVTALAGHWSEVTGTRRVVLSGGVWQNITLLRRTLSLLQAADFEVYLHSQVPPNDGGISLGQAVVAAAGLRANDVSGRSGQDN